MEKPKKGRKPKTPVVENKVSPEIKNYYLLDEVKAFQEKSHNPNFSVHGIQVPFRMIVIGASGSGKTNVVVNLINQFNDTFNNIDIYTRCKAEPLYEYLELKIGKEFLKISEGLTDFNKLDPNKAYDKKDQRLIIFDDLCLEKDQSKIAELFIRGRKLGVSLIYITQQYYKVPKEIRGQTNYIILKKISSTRDLNLILSDCTLGVDKKVLNNMYKFCIRDITHFLLIDLNVEQDLMFRHNFVDILNPANFE
jgi:hypothetical protein